jgi:tRNA pseudouridine38-40 synthase
MQYRFILEYDGTAYHGWQVQPGARTVQAVVEQAVAQLIGESVRVAAAGRTDAGVHASGQVASFRTERTLSPDTIGRALNALTPADVSIREVALVDDGFDVRRSARSRTYVYRIWTRRVRSPLWRLYAWHVIQSIDVAAMTSAAASLVGEHDFTSFRAAGCDAAQPVRRVLRSEVVVSDDLITYTIEANAFLRHMVRNIVGTLVEVGTSRRRPDDIAALLRRRDRSAAGKTAPAHGLCLTRVTY